MKFFALHPGAHYGSTGKAKPVLAALRGFCPGVPFMICSSHSSLAHKRGTSTADWDKK
jgi:hypothetical protein